MSGKLYSLEGIEGCGKSTVLTEIKSKLAKANQLANWLFTHEPGGTDAGEDIRNLLLNQNYSADLSLTTQSLLFAASRSELNDKVIIPALNSDKNVLVDRYVDSSYVYQSLLSVNQKQSLPPNWVKEINRYAIKPSLVFWLDINPELAQKRINKRIKATGQQNYLDLKPEKEQYRRREAFEHLYHYSDNIIRIKVDEEHSSKIIAQQILTDIKSDLNKSDNID